jgi:hypothetical protein
MVASSTPEPGPVEPAAAALRAERAAKRNGRIAWVLLLALVAGYFYLQFYRPVQEAKAPWDEAQVLGGPYGWDGAEGVHENTAIAVGFYRSGGQPAETSLDRDVESLHAWLEKLGITLYADAESLRDQCFRGTSCYHEFTHGEYRGWLLVYAAGPAPEGGVDFALRYEFWKPLR